MAYFYLLLLLFVCSFGWFFLWKNRDKEVSDHHHGSKNIHYPPGPRKLPIIGNLHQLGELPHRSFHSLSLTHGPLMFLQLGSFPAIVVSSADKARELLRNRDHAISNRSVSYTQRKLFYDSSDMVFSPYGEYWREVRKLCTLELFTFKRAQSFRGVREEELESLMDSISMSSSSGTTSTTVINLSESILVLVNNIVCRTVFGQRYGEYGSKSRFHDILAEFQALLGVVSVSDFFPHLEWIHKYFTGLDAKVEKVFRELDHFFDEVIETHQNPDFRRSDGGQGEDLVDVLLKAQKDTNLRIPFSINNIKAVLMDIFVAGTDTSSALIVWGMTQLMRNPSVRMKAQAEVRRVVGNKVKMEESDLYELEYLRAVIKETFRLHPPSPLLVPRETTEKLTVDGYTIPSKSRVFVNATAIGLDPKCWDSPEEFRPERFLNSRIDYRGKHFELIPFGAGRRGCPGINFAVPTVELALANLLHRFDWELPPGMGVGDLDTEEATGITIHKRTPLCLVASAARVQGVI